jgi:NAD(P)-dependent dehydrogenase (short-subunit alcohol dehydrogenase family)
MRAGAPVDVLVNDAGVMAPRRVLSPQGHEMQFAANHLGHFALTGLLLDLLQSRPRPAVERVVGGAEANASYGRPDERIQVEHPHRHKLAMLPTEDKCRGRTRRSVTCRPLGNLAGFPSALEDRGSGGSFLR